MAEFHPVFRSEDLPAPMDPLSIESDVLDFKGKDPTTGEVPLRPFEVAKDVASFANASGGVLLYGAREDGARRLRQWEPLTRAEVDKMLARIGAYATGRDGRCRPAPVIDCRDVAVEGGFVLAVNVFASSGQAIAVAMPWQELSAPPDVKQESFIYPVRVGDRTRYLDSEQVSMLMIPDLRRKLSLLRQIPPGAPLSNPYTGHRFTLISIDEFANAFCVRLVNGEKDLWLPIDILIAVWRDGDEWSAAFPMGISPAELNRLR